MTFIILYQHLETIRRFLVWTLGWIRHVLTVSRSRQEHTEAANFRVNYVRSLRLGWRRGGLLEPTQVKQNCRRPFMGLHFVYVTCGLRDRDRQTPRARGSQPRESNCCAWQLFFIVKNVSRLCLMSTWVSSCYYALCLHEWHVRLSRNVSAWCTTGKLLGKYL